MGMYACHVFDEIPELRYLFVLHVSWIVDSWECMHAMCLMLFLNYDIYLFCITHGSWIHGNVCMSRI